MISYEDSFMYGDINIYCEICWVVGISLNRGDTETI